MFTYYTSHCAFMSQSRFNTMVNDWSSHLSIAASIWCWGGGGDNGCGYGLSRETENQTPLSLDVIITPFTTAVMDSQRPRVNDWTYGVFYETSLSTFLSMNHHQVLYLKKNDQYLYHNFFLPTPRYIYMFRWHICLYLNIDLGSLKREKIVL